TTPLYGTTIAMTARGGHRDTLEFSIRDRLYGCGGCRPASRSCGSRTNAANTCTAGTCTADVCSANLTAADTPSADPPTAARQHAESGSGAAGDGREPHDDVDAAGPYSEGDS